MGTKTSIKSLSRQAIVMDVGGFRPPDDPIVSWFGRVNIALPGETWPMDNDGKPMHALCQINLTELPSRPSGLDDLAMIVLFIGPSRLPVDEPNGSNWCLRAYSDLSLLQPLEKSNHSSSIKALPMRARLVAKDYPCLDDAGELGVEIDDEDEYQERFPNAEGFKFGGWPTLVQNPIEWTSQDSNTEYVFQIDSNEKAHWAWGHGGVGYIGRCKSTGEWHLSWQSL